MKKVAVIGAILEKPQLSQTAFNDTVSTFKGMIKGRMGIPLEEADMAVVSLTVVGEADDINALTGRLGNLPHVTVKTTISGKVVE